MLIDGALTPSEKAPAQAHSQGVAAPAAGVVLLPAAPSCAT